MTETETQSKKSKIGVLKELIMGVINSSSNLVTQKELTEKLSKPSVNINIALRGLVKDGQLTRTREGKRFFYSKTTQQ